MRNKQILRLKKHQTGITLFVSLIYLTLLTLMATSLSNVSGIEEKMSGNSRNRDLAYQAAQAALSYVEQNLNAGANLSSYFVGYLPSGYIPSPNTTVVNVTGQSGMREINACLPNSINYWNNAGDSDCNGTTGISFDWTTAQTLSVTIGSVATQPKFVIERLPDGSSQQRYRVTARGTGGDDNAVVILQALFSFS
jgi:type IV pilus assembly protein PilX